MYLNPVKDQRGFQVLGCDFIESDDGDLFFLEGNQNPSLYDEGNPLKKVIHRNMEDDLVYGVMKTCVEPMLKNRSPLIKSMHGFKFLCRYPLKN